MGTPYKRLVWIIVALASTTGMTHAAQAFCLSSCRYAQTKYPVVLAHGVFGFNKVFGAVDYWYGIPSALRRAGADVFVDQVSPVNTPERRGLQLLHYIEDVLAVTGKRKVHIIAHSYGGLDARFVAAVRPSAVASVTTIGSPHAGSQLADFFWDLAQAGAWGNAFVGALGSAVAKLVRLFSGSQHPNDVMAGLEAVTTHGAKAFAEKYPTGLPKHPCGTGDEVVDRIRYYSWSGNAIFTTATDPSDALLAVAGSFSSEPNDGVVEQCSTHFGRVIRDNYFQNHFDEVNHLLGASAWFAAKPISLFRAQANRLKNLGL